MGMKINAKGMHYKELNQRIKGSVAEGAKEIIVENASGQRYIGTGVEGEVNITIHGTPGSDLAAFGNGPNITVYGNGQEAVGNTLNKGDIIVHGHVNDVLGVAMRGGKIYVRDNVGYRAGIHMKAYKDLVPVIMIGGTAQNFLGEYMAGGLIIVLGLNRGDRPIVGDYVGTGMHGGKIFLRGTVEKDQIGKEVSVMDLDHQDHEELRKYVVDFCSYFGFCADEILKEPFIKLVPVSARPYGQLYVP
jgi:glutamate synthase domain-containing protein 3